MPKLGKSERGHIFPAIFAFSCTNEYEFLNSLIKLGDALWNQEETVEEFMENGVDDLVVSLYQMDLDRTLFLLRSYLRIRLQKVMYDL